MGIIYQIINDINQHRYIGQTRTSLEARWQKHISRFKWENQSKGIYGAFAKYGIENFHIEPIENCPDDILDEREKFWIEYYNTFYGDGYNLTIGGQDGACFKIDLPKEEIISLYCSRQYSCDDIGDIYGCSGNTISHRLKEWGISKVSTIKQEEIQKKNLEKGRHRPEQYESLIPHINSLKKKVARLNNKGEIEKIYSSLSEACRDLGQATNHTNRISAAIEKNGICFGYHWKYIS